MIDEVPVRETVLRPENLQYRFAIALNRFTSFRAFDSRLHGVPGGRFTAASPAALNCLRDSRPPAGHSFPGCARSPTSKCRSCGQACFPTHTSSPCSGPRRPHVRPVRNGLLHQFDHVGLRLVHVSRRIVLVQRLGQAVDFRGIPPESSLV